MVVYMFFGSETMLICVFKHFSTALVESKAELRARIVAEFVVRKKDKIINTI